MRMVREIVLPETEPETEWIFDRPVQKVSPTRTHSLLQLAFGRALGEWAVGQGDVGSEWRFRAAPPGEDIRPLVPDVAYISYERLRQLSAADRETPILPPEIVVEILSPGDRRRHVAEKRRVYFAWGVDLILMVEPRARLVEAYGRDGEYERVDASVESYAPPRFPRLRLPLRAMFATLEIPEPG